MGILIRDLDLASAQGPGFVNDMLSSAIHKAIGLVGGSAPGWIFLETNLVRHIVLERANNRVWVSVHRRMGKTFYD